MGSDGSESKIWHLAQSILQKWKKFSNGAHTITIFKDSYSSEFIKSNDVYLSSEGNSIKLWPSLAPNDLVLGRLFELAPKILDFLLILGAYPKI